MIEVKIISLEKVLFAEKVNSVVLPGEEGVFTVLNYHKPLVTRLISGKVILDKKEFKIKRGVVKVSNNKVLAIVEE